MSVVQPIKRAIFAVESVTSPYGLSPVQFFQRLRADAFTRRSLREFHRLYGTRTDWPIGRIYPFDNRRTQAGGAYGHYFHQDLWTAHRIYAANPRRHIDIGSRIDGFVAHVASFREIEILDLLPLPWSVPNVKFMQLDLMQPIPQDMLEICDSLSSLHALEHFGLGRYGDAIDPDGYLKGFANMSQLLQPGGTFYFSVPMGRQRIEFNAHRIFSLDHLLEIFDQNGLRVERYAYVGDDGALRDDVQVSVEARRIANNLNYGCGIFELSK